MVDADCLTLANRRLSVLKS